VRQPSLNRISEHVYWLAPDATTDRPTLGAIVGKQATLVVDAGNSPTHANLLLDELTNLSLAKPSYVVLTHWHWDHVFGASAFEAPIFAHEETHRVVEEMTQLDWSDHALDRRVEEGTEIEFCRDMIKAEWPDRSNLQVKLPDVSFVTQLEFNLGGVKCQVKHVGGDHASDSSIVYIPEDNIVFLGDCLYEDLHNGPRNYTIQKLFPLIDEIMSYRADYYVFSHNLEPMPKIEMMEFVGLLKLVGELGEQTGGNRELILQELQGKLGQILEDDHLEIVDAFLAGLRASKKK
jgi:glyoxylase-like metal-dependent hydrolase (beta-lactamase superfamily II)